MASGMTRYEDVRNALKSNIWYTMIKIEHAPKRIIAVRRKGGVMQVKTMKDGRWITPGKNHVIYAG